MPLIIFIGLFFILGLAAQFYFEKLVDFFPHSLGILPGLFGGCVIFVLGWGLIGFFAVYVWLWISSASLISLAGTLVPLIILYIYWMKTRK